MAKKTVNKEIKVANGRIPIKKTVKKTAKPLKNIIKSIDYTRKLSSKAEAEKQERRKFVWELFVAKVPYRQISEMLRHVKYIVFRSDDFVSPRSLFLKLKAKADPVSEFISSRLSDNTRQSVADFNGSVPIHPDYIELLTADFNHLIKSNYLSDHKAFKQVQLSPETKELLETGNENELWRLNRLLIEDAYPLEIRKVLHVRGISPSQVFADVQYLLGLQYQDQKLEVEQYIEAEIAVIDKVNLRASEFLPKVTDAEELKHVKDVILDCVKERSKLRNLYKPKEIRILNDSDFAAELGIPLEALPDGDDA